MIDLSVRLISVKVDGTIYVLYTPLALTNIDFFVEMERAIFKRECKDHSNRSFVKWFNSRWYKEKMIVEELNALKEPAFTVGETSEA